MSDALELHHFRAEVAAKWYVRWNPGADQFEVQDADSKEWGPIEAHPNYFEIASNIAMGVRHWVEGQNKKRRGW